MSIYIGTSGYNYKHWANGVFYPNSLPQNRWLDYYSSYFNAVELNVSFYRLPKKETFQKWKGQTPSEFCFVAKGSRYITHIKRLKDSLAPLKRFFANAIGLGKKMALVLWQLPPHAKIDIERLTLFCKNIKETRYATNIGHVFEFRHRSWFVEETYKVLRNNNFALCMAHSSRWPLEMQITADYIYLRFHGGEGIYDSNYPDRDLRKWADRVKEWQSKVKDIYAFFNNDAHCYAVKNGLRLKELVRN